MMNTWALSAIWVGLALAATVIRPPEPAESAEFHAVH